VSIASSLRPTTELDAAGLEAAVLLDDGDDDDDDDDAGPTGCCSAASIGVTRATDVHPADVADGRPRSMEHLFNCLC
jgi:hypothetical protein